MLYGFKVVRQFIALLRLFGEDGRWLACTTCILRAVYSL